MEENNEFTTEQVFGALVGLLISKGLISNEDWSKALDLAREYYKSK